VINANWNQGAEWRDWFVTGIGVKELEFRPDPAVADRLERHLRALYQAEQQAIYGRLLKPALGTSSIAAAPLFDLMNEMSLYKGLLRHQLILFYPEVMLDADEIRAAVEGQNGLLDEAALRRWQENNMAVAQIHDIVMARLEQFQAAWKRQPEALMRSGTVAVSVAHAVARLNALYREYFATRAPVSSSLETVPANPPGVSAGSATPGT
jgi:hypothetical protein